MRSPADAANHVVTADHVDNTAVLDGFIITAGQANGGYPYYNGGGMYNSSSNPTLTNVILWGNTAPNGAGIYNNSSMPTVSYSDIQGCGGSGSWNFACGTDGGGNIDADPLFVDAAGGNLRLQEGSPAIDAGNSDAVPPGITTDLDGKPRIVDGNGDGNAVVDMGAYEFQRLYFTQRIYLPLVMRNTR